MERNEAAFAIGSRTSTLRLSLLLFIPFSLFLFVKSPPFLLPVSSYGRQGPAFSMINSFLFQFSMKIRCNAASVSFQVDYFIGRHFILSNFIILVFLQRPYFSLKTSWNRCQRKRDRTNDSFFSFFSFITFRHSAMDIKGERYLRHTRELFSPLKLVTTWWPLAPIDPKKNMENHKEVQTAAANSDVILCGTAPDSWPRTFLFFGFSCWKRKTSPEFDLFG